MNASPAATTNDSASSASSASSANSATSANSAIALRLELLGVPVPDHAARSDFDRSAG